MDAFEEEWDAYRRKSPMDYDPKDVFRAGWEARKRAEFELLAAWPEEKKKKYKPRGETQTLGYLVEECGEVQHVAGKSLRWGLLSFNKELPLNQRETNRDWLLRELVDLQRALSMVQLMLSAK